MIDSGTLRPASEVVDRYLNGLQNAIEHKELAVAAALHFCAEEKIIPPKWVLDGSARLLCDLLKREKAQSRGRTAGRLSRYRQSACDVERWNAVEQIREIRERNKADARLIKEYPASYSDSQKEHVQRMRNWLVKYGTFACASMYLHGAYSRAGVDAMKASHRRVSHAFKDPLNTRYWYIHPPFLWEVGIDDRIGVPGTKYGPLYDLTP